MRMIAWLSTVRFGESHVIMDSWGAQGSVAHNLLPLWASCSSLRPLDRRPADLRHAPRIRGVSHFDKGRSLIMRHPPGRHFLATIYRALAALLRGRPFD
jgi:hypothetical protein